MTVRYVLYDPMDVVRHIDTGVIPREDVEIYLTAKSGEAECFVSANRELIRYWPSNGAISSVSMLKRLSACTYHQGDSYRQLKATASPSQNRKTCAESLSKRKLV